jgi:hypothetical protein
MVKVVARVVAVGGAEEVVVVPVVIAVIVAIVEAIAVVVLTDTAPQAKRTITIP